MNYENILIENQNQIAILTINRPKSLNALNRQTLAELKHFFEEGHKTIQPLKGVVITGAGEKAFVAGADISEFSGLDPQGALEMSQSGQDIFFSIERFHKPVIAAVNGFALGGGCELAMACHMRIATEQAKFGQPEVNLGLIPGYGGTQRLIQYIGKSKAIELLMTADMLTASEAYRLGLLNHVVDSTELIGKATEIIEKIASKAPVAIQKIVETVQAYFDTSGFNREVIEFSNTANTADFIEGAQAFLEKRKANFQGK